MSMPTNAPEAQIPEGAPARKGNGTWYDLSKGVFKFRDADKIERTTPQVKGLLTGITVEWDEGNPANDIEPGERLALSITAPDGERLLVRARAKVFCYCLVPLLMHVRAGQAIFLSVNPGSKGNVSFPNLYVSNGNSWVEIRDVEKLDGDDRFEQAMKLIKTHPDYKDSESDEEHDEFAEGPTPMEAFDNALKAKGWPTLAEKGDVYLQMADEIGDDTYLTLEDVPEPVWAEFRVALAEATKIPAVLQEVKEVAKVAKKKNPLA